ncbi:MAG: hypothetical protein H0V11_08980, partial [Actinobacteria bacterium]|nr:hypothetical protein [Actinomycetota bacterium]
EEAIPLHVKKAAQASTEALITRVHAALDAMKKTFDEALDEGEDDQT